MSWFAVDDRFLSHRKVAALRRGDRFGDSVAIWTLAGSWACADDEAKDSGIIPLDVIATLGVLDWELAVKELVRVGLLHDLSDDAVAFHDWDHWNGPGAKAKRLEKRLEADRIRQQTRRSQGLSKVSHVTNLGQSRDSNVTQGNGYGSEATTTNQTTPSVRKVRAPKPEREDARRLCDHLADRIEANGSKRPNITVRWLDAARLLLDLDGRTEDQVHRAIDWCQDDAFWRANVLSMPTLREKYDTLRLRAQADGEPARKATEAPRAGSGVWGRTVSTQQTKETA